MKDEILKQLQSSDESTSICVVFTTVAIGIGVNLSGIRHVVHISVPGTIESIYQDIIRYYINDKYSNSMTLQSVGSIKQQTC